MTWDEIRTVDWDKAQRPQPFVLSYSTTGCGCCSDGDIEYSAEKAVEIVREHIREREEELARWRAWLVRMESSAEILPCE